MEKWINSKTHKTSLKDSLHRVFKQFYNSIFKTELNEGLANKQDKLISGTNVKTINGESVLGSGDIDTTPTLDKVLKKDNTSEEVAKVGGVEVVHEDSGNSSELYAAGLNLEYNYEGQENRRMAHIDYESVGFSHLERNTSPSGGYNIVPDFVVSARNGQVEMNEAIKGAFREKLGITNEVFIAKQGTTSAAELIAAYEANQAILIVPSGTIYTSWRWLSIGLDRKSATKCEVIAIFINGSNLNSGLTLVKFTVDGTTWTYASQGVQNKLVSGENIKTINGNSLLGEGNIDVSSSGGAEFGIDEASNTGVLGQNNDYFGVDISQDDAVELSLTKPGEYAKNKTVPTKEYVDGKIGSLTDLTTTGKTNLVAALNEVNGKVGMNLEIGVEKWYGTYREANVTYQVYTKTIKIDALPATAGITEYPHGITGIKQILSAYGFGTNGFVLNAPRQNAQDNISIYQVQKGGNIAIEVGKNRSNMGAYIVLIYAKNN